MVSVHSATASRLHSHLKSVSADPRFRLGDGPQQIHVSIERNPLPTLHRSSRHPCFALPDGASLDALQRKIYEHHAKGGEAAAIECDAPGAANSGDKVSEELGETEA